jgi:hypothetical protein
MSGADEDDEWSNAEVNLKSLSLVSFTIPSNRDFC